MDTRSDNSFIKQNYCSVKLNLKLFNLIFIKEILNIPSI